MESFVVFGRLDYGITASFRNLEGNDSIKRMRPGKPKAEVTQCDLSATIPLKLVTHISSL